MLAAAGLLALFAAALAHALVALGALGPQHLLGAAANIVALAPAAAVFGLSGTIYDSPPAHTVVYKVGSPDLNEQLGSGFQAAHLWVNNKSNQYLYIPGAPDVVGPGVTRVLALMHTDVGQASWTVPATYAVTQPNNPAGAAILVFLNAGIDIAPTPGVIETPTVSSPQINLGTLVVAAGQAKNSNFAVPTGTHSIGIAIENAGVLSQLTVTGVQSGTVYLSLPAAGAFNNKLSGLFMSPVLSSLDSQVNVAAKSAAGATVAVVAILDPEAEFVFNNLNQPTIVELVGVTGTVLGDTSTAALVPDAVSEQINSGSSSGGNAGVIASFKALAGSVIALVGSAGAFTVGTNTAVTPPFGQATVAGHLLIACVHGAQGAQPTTVAAGWTKVIDQNGSLWDAIWIKANCGAAEAAPQFTCAGASPMFAQVFEVSGAPTAAPTDQAATSGGEFAFPPMIVNTNAADVAFGDLVVVCSSWFLSVANTATFTQTYNNGATAVAIGSSGGVARNRHASHSFAIIPAGTLALPLGVTVWDVDAQGSSNPAVGTVASVVLAATAGKKYRAHFLSASIGQSGATAQNAQAQLKDGVGIIHTRQLYINANAQTVVGFEVAGLSLPGTTGNSMTLAFSAVVATVGQAVTIGAYLR